MNYYERHLGDYARDTAHLSMLEHGAYGLLLDRYYATEQGIPDGQQHRLARARSREEKAAVDAVLNEFFTLEDDIWVHKRVAQEIKKFQSEEPEREQNRQHKQENAKARKKRHNERKRVMFDDLRSIGIVPDWNIKIHDLETLHAKNKERMRNATGTRSGTQQERPPDAVGTTTQTPDTRHQSPDICVSNDTHSGVSLPTAAGAVCLALKSAGLPNVNPSHPDLQELLAAGATVDDFVSAARGMKQRETPPRNPFAYVLGVVKGQRDDAKEAASKTKTKGARHDRHDVEEPA